MKNISLEFILFIKKSKDFSLNFQIKIIQKIENHPIF